MTVTKGGAKLLLAENLAWQALLRVLVSCIFAILEVVSLSRDFFGLPRGLFPVCWGFYLYAMLYAMRTVFDHATISIRNSNFKGASIRQVHGSHMT